jgi:uncharacterized membrane protein YsdA (DUF1294 family)
MSLVVGTLLMVSIGTVVLGFVVYVVDRSTARQERLAGKKD